MIAAARHCTHVEGMPRMFKLWKDYRSRRQLSRLLQPDAAKLDGLSETKAERHRLADTNGKLRRLRQLAENSRLL